MIEVLRGLSVHNHSILLPGTRNSNLFFNNKPRKNENELRFSKVMPKRKTKNVIEIRFQSNAKTKNEIQIYFSMSCGIEKQKMEMDFEFHFPML